MNTKSLRLICSFFLIITLHVSAHYHRNPDVSYDKWVELSPYFLPEDHPIKEKLDEIFKTRVTLNEESVENARFHFVKFGKPKRPKIVSHPDLEGYLLKIYFDSQIGVDETKNFVKRIKGAKVAKELIEQYNFEDLFIVPQKWLYPLPLKPLPPEGKGYDQKNFVLVVERIDVYKKDENKYYWKRWFSPELVLALYTVLDKGGFSDSTFVFNLPFSKDGKIAIIDTEIYNSWPINYRRLNNYFSDDMKDYWISLTD